MKFLANIQIDTVGKMGNIFVNIKKQNPVFGQASAAEHNQHGSSFFPDNSLLGTKSASTSGYIGACLLVAARDIFMFHIWSCGMLSRRSCQFA